MNYLNLARDFYWSQHLKDGRLIERHKNLFLCSSIHLSAKIGLGENTDIDSKGNYTTVKSSINSYGEKRRARKISSPGKCSQRSLGFLGSPSHFFRKKTIDPDHFRPMTNTFVFKRGDNRIGLHEINFRVNFLIIIQSLRQMFGCIQIIFDCIQSLSQVNHCSEVFSSGARWSQPKRVPKKVSSQFTSSYR